MESTINFKKNLLAIFLLLVSSFAAEAEDIRIAVFKDRPDAVISVRGSYRIIDVTTKKEYFSARQMKKSRVKPVGKEIAIGSVIYATKHLRVVSQKDIAIYVDSKKLRYRGSLDFIVDKNGNLLIINTLDMETYVKGVLYHEVSHRWPMEAMKAQAVAARTYALYQSQVSKKQLFDVTNDVYSQMYGGRTAERYRTNIAVNKTKGEVLMYQGKVLPAYYHSNSGGHTENAKELWKHDLPPLSGRVDEYAVGLPNYEWKRNFQSKAFQKKLEDEGYKIDLIKDIRIVGRSASGRVKLVEVEDKNGNVIKVTGQEFRKLLGVNEIKSSLFEVVMRGYFFDILGHGWGHGVGMCQWGAYAMATKRFKYNDILLYYYPGAEIQNLLTEEKPSKDPDASE